MGRILFVVVFYRLDWWAVFFLFLFFRVALAAGNVVWEIFPKMFPIRPHSNLKNIAIYMALKDNKQ